MARYTNALYSRRLVKEVDTIVAALSEARERGRGALTFVRCQSKEATDEALGKFLGTTGWNWHEIDAGDCVSGHQLLTRAKGLTVDEDDVWLATNLPPAQGPNGRPDYYQAMAEGSSLVDVLGGPRMVIFVGVPQMQAIVRNCQELWKRKRAFVAWPIPEVQEKPRAVHVQAGAAPQPGDAFANAAMQGDPAVVIQALTQQIQNVQSATEKGKLFHRLALVLGTQGRVEEARVSATKAAKIYKEASDPRGLAQCYEVLGSLAERRRNIEVARDWIGFALESWSQIEDKSRCSECRAKLGHLNYVLGDREQAAQHFQLAIELDESLGEKLKVAAGLRRLGLMAEEEQKFRIADKLYDDSLQLCREEGDEVGVSRSLHAKGRLYERSQDYGQAFEMHKESLAIKEQLNDRLGMATSYHHLGNTYLFSRDFAQARTCYQQALQIEDEVGDNQGRAATLQQLGEVSMAEYRWGDALWYFLAAHALFRQLGSPVAHTVALHVNRATEMLDEETVEQIKTDVREKMSAYQVD